MKKSVILPALAAASIFYSSGFASSDNACQTPSISTVADVTTSYGSNYRVETYYRTPSETAARFVINSPALLIVEGPLTWTRSEKEDALTGDKQRRFIIGHQYHALAFNFEDIMSDIEEVQNIAFNGKQLKGLKGHYPTGGVITRVTDGNDDRPAGLIMQLPDEAEIRVAFSEWRRTQSGHDAFFKLTITHNENTFNYRYTDISFSNKDAIDFDKAFPAPSLDQVNIYRLHRALLAAHCRGDAAIIAALTAPQSIIANRGSVSTMTPDGIRTQFKSLFEQMKYSAHSDVQPAKISVSDSGDLGWAIVNVRAEGEAAASGEPFLQQWAWAMLAKKVDGVWLSAGNASNLRSD
jgi:ketosteroid isomerase-like protein